MAMTMMLSLPLPSPLHWAAVMGGGGERKNEQYAPNIESDDDDATEERVQRIIMGNLIFPLRFRFALVILIR